MSAYIFHIEETEKNLEYIKYSLDIGVEFQTTDPNDLLGEAILKKKFAIAELLLQRDYDINRTTTRRLLGNDIHYPVCLDGYCDQEQLDFMLAHGLDVTAVDRHGMGLIHLSHTTEDTLRMLIDEGIDIETVSGNYNVDYLSPRAPPPVTPTNYRGPTGPTGPTGPQGFCGSGPSGPSRGTPLLHATAANSCEKVKFLLERGANVYAVDETTGNGIFHYASDGEMIRTIFNFHAGDVDTLTKLVRHKNHKGETFLFSRYRPEEFLQDMLTFLPEGVLDLTATDTTGKTLLHVCCDSFVDLIPSLVEMGACTTTIDRNGQTPLHVLCGGYCLDRESLLELIPLLVSNGAGDVIDSRGKTAFDCAVARFGVLTDHDYTCYECGHDHSDEHDSLIEEMERDREYHNFMDELCKVFGKKTETGSPWFSWLYPSWLYSSS